MSQFLNQKEVTLNSANYLVVLGTNKPIYNELFVAQQKKAHFMITLANEARGKNFEVKTADNFSELVEKVNNHINSTQNVEYVESAEQPHREITQKLAEEAKSWLNFEKQNEENEKINLIMQEFNQILEFEKFGAFFNDSQIVKLNKIYTIEQILAAVKSIAKFVN